MPLSRSIAAVAIATLCVLGCGKDSTPAASTDAKVTPPVVAKPKARTPPNDPHAIAKANDNAPAPPPMDASRGTFDATIAGKPTHLLRIPPAQNRAIAFPDKGLSRVSIAAAEGHEGWPHLRLILEGLMLDDVQYPITIPSDAAAAKGVTATLRYQVNENRIYTSAALEEMDLSVTLDSLVGNRLSGSFTGMVAPSAAGIGGPIPITAEFSIEMGLRGVKPGPTPEAKPTEAAADPKPSADPKPTADPSE